MARRRRARERPVEPTTEIADLRKHRRLQQQNRRRRRRVAIVRWSAAVTSIGAGCAVAVSIGSLLGAGPAPLWLRIWLGALGGAFFGGVAAFAMCYGMGAADLLLLGLGYEPPAPDRVAWRVGIPLAIGGSTLFATRFEWPQVLLALLGGTGGIAAWWCLGRIRAAER